jgi:transposase-like protein
MATGPLAAGASGERRGRVRRYSTAYKARILAEYETLDKKGKGALLQRERLYASLISEWRKQRDRGAFAADTPAHFQAELAALRRENERLGAELAKVRKVLELQMRLSALLDQPGPITPEGEGRSRD